MPIYHGGVNKDGSIYHKEFEGFHTSPNGEYWGTLPVDNNGNFIEENKKINFKHKSKYHG